MGMPFFTRDDERRFDSMNLIRLCDWYDRLARLSATLNLEVDDSPKVRPEDCAWNGFPRIALHDRVHSCANCMYHRVCGNCYWGICLRNDIETGEFRAPGFLYFPLGSLRISATTVITRP